MFPCKKSALDAMNKFRIQLAAGNISAKNGKFPMGKEIYKLVNFKIVLLISLNH